MNTYFTKIKKLENELDDLSKFKNVSRDKISSLKVCVFSVFINDFLFNFFTYLYYVKYQD